MRGRSALAALALAALAACGGDAEPRAQATTAPPTTVPPTTVPPTSAVPTPTATDLRRALREAAIAQETYFEDEGTYTKDVAALADQGYEGLPGVELSIVSASREAYCLRATGGGTSVYYSSRSGQPSETPCS